MTLGMNRSQGEARIAHTDIDKLDIPQQRLTVGMCAQHNTLFEALTVAQGLRMIGAIKGLTQEDQDK